MAGSKRETTLSVPGLENWQITGANERGRQERELQCRPANSPKCGPCTGADASVHAVPARGGAAWPRPEDHEFGATIPVFGLAHSKASLI